MLKRPGREAEHSPVGMSKLGMHLIRPISTHPASLYGVHSDNCYVLVTNVASIETAPRSKLCVVVLSVTSERKVDFKMGVVCFQFGLVCGSYIPFWRKYANATS